MVRVYSNQQVDDLPVLFHIDAWIGVEPLDEVADLLVQLLPEKFSRLGLSADL